MKLAIKKLTAHAVQRSRPKLSLGMIGKLKLLGASSKKKARAAPQTCSMMCSSCAAAWPFVRGGTDWRFNGAHATVWIAQGGRHCRCRWQVPCCRADSLSACS